MIRLCFGCFQVPQGRGSLDCSPAVEEACEHFLTLLERIETIQIVTPMNDDDQMHLARSWNRMASHCETCNRAIPVPAEPENSKNIVESVLDFGDRFLRDEVPD